jgi:hypothetical protein
MIPRRPVLAVDVRIRKVSTATESGWAYPVGRPPANLSQQACAYYHGRGINPVLARELGNQSLVAPPVAINTRTIVIGVKRVTYIGVAKVRQDRRDVVWQQLVIVG